MYGMLESSIVFIAAWGRVSGKDESKITVRGRSRGRVTINIVSGRYARSTSPYRRPGQCVWCMHVSSISVYRCPGKCVRYRRQGQGVWYGNAQYRRPRHRVLCQVCTRARAPPGVVSEGRVMIDSLWPCEDVWRARRKCPSEVLRSGSRRMAASRCARLLGRAARDHPVRLTQMHAEILDGSPKVKTFCRWL